MAPFEMETPKIASCTIPTRTTEWKRNFWSLSKSYFIFNIFWHQSRPLGGSEYKNKTNLSGDHIPSYWCWCVSFCAAATNVGFACICMLTTGWLLWYLVCLICTKYEVFCKRTVSWLQDQFVKKHVCLSARLRGSGRQILITIISCFHSLY